MEITIIGVIVVGLMVYVSTRIKKASRQAYEREVFETKGFKIVKPDDFIIPIGENSAFVFEARSRDFGIDEASDFYQCRATITERNGTAEARDFQTQQTAEKNVSFNSFHKAIFSPAANKTYELRIVVLSEFKDKYQVQVDEMLNSFAAQ